MHWILCLVLSPVHLILTVHLIHQELMQGQEEAMRPSSVEREAEMRALKEELQLALKKEREAQVFVNHEIIRKHKVLVFLRCYMSYSFVLSLQNELSALRLSLAHHQVEGVATEDSTDHQV